MFLLVVCFCFLSQGAVANLCSNSFVSLVCCFLCQRELLMQSYCLFLELHWNRLLFVTVLRIKKSKKIQKMLRLLCCFLMMLRNFHYFKICSSEQRKCLKIIRQYRLFWFGRFCLLFCILSFTSFNWFLFM